MWNLATITAHATMLEALARAARATAETALHVSPVGAGLETAREQRARYARVYRANLRASSYLARAALVRRGLARRGVTHA